MTGKQIRRVRHAMGLTQVEFAERVGLTGNSVARIERGAMIITKTVALLVAYVAREAGVESPHGQASGGKAPAKKRAHRGKARIAGGKNRARSGDASLPSGRR